jgi:uncharacterized protein (DUF1778 family)
MMSNKIVRVCLKKEQFEEIKSKADLTGKSLSSFMKEHALEQNDELEKVMRAVIEKMMLQIYEKVNQNGTGNKL